MKRYPGLLLFATVAVVSILPLLNVSAGTVLPWLTPHIVAALNLLGWSLVLTFLFSRRDQRIKITALAKDFGIETRGKALELLLDLLLTEMSRRQKALKVELLEQRITSKEELSQALERIVALAFKLLRAESAELALFDKDTGLYHSSFVLGKPFRNSTQAMLSGAIEGEERETSPDVMVHPIAFAGTVLGSIRVGLERGRVPTSGDHEIIHLLALQSGMALINAQYNQELLQMKRVSEESVKAKTGFLANLSHEIRGPLGIILNAAELISDGLCGPINDEQRDTIKMVRSNCEHLLDLINDVLDYAKIESGKIKPDTVELSVDELLSTITQVVRVQADSKAHSLNYTAPTEALAIRCDRRHARQILINLLTNAIKYTQDGGTIEVWAERAPGGKIKLNVRDSGVGIERADRHKVFAAFERIDNSYSIQQMGTGLGMPLTKRLVEMNGGMIDFSSAPGKGSHFWVLFPGAQFGATVPLQDQSGAEAPRGRDEAILVVQRDAQERRVIERYLGSRGYRIIACQNEEEVLHSMTQQNFSLALVDNDVVDNLEESVIKRIRESKTGTVLPILLLSTRAFVFDIEKYLKAGIDRCLTKPIELGELARICRETIDAVSVSSRSMSAVKRDGTPAPRRVIVRADDNFH